MMDDFTLESEDFDDNLPYVELQLDVNDVHLIYRSLNKMLETWIWRTSNRTREVVLFERFCV